MDSTIFFVQVLITATFILAVWLKKFLVTLIPFALSCLAVYAGVVSEWPMLAFPLPLIIALVSVIMFITQAGNGDLI